MPRGRKRKRTASEVDPLSDNGTTRDSNADSGTTRDDGGPENSTGEGGIGRTGTSRDSSRAAGHSAGRTGRNDGSNDSEGIDSGVNSAGGHPPTPLTRDDIPALVREIARQLRPDDAEVHTPLVPGTMCCVSLVFPY